VGAVVAVATAVDPRAPSDELFRAIEGGDVEQVQKLVAADPACASTRNGNGLSAVLAATYRHRADLVAILLAANPVLDAFDASAVGDIDRLRELLDTDREAATAFAPDGFTALSLAAYFGQPEAVRLLLERGADVAAPARNPMQVQPLHAAVAGNNRGAVALLLAAGADPDARQHGGWTPLMQAAAHGDVEVVDLFLGAGADPSLADEEGKTAADRAEEHGYRDLAERLRQLSR
jgi:ankyrin repeat protein